MGLCYQYGNGVAQNDAGVIKFYQKAANLGSVNAQYNLGKLLQGVDGEKDVELAVSMFTDAADQGHANAQNILASHCKHGKGIRQSDEEAFKYYKLATDQNHTEAQQNVGLCYQNGVAVEKDDEQAAYTISLQWTNGMDLRSFTWASFTKLEKGSRQVSLWRSGFMGFQAVKEWMKQSE